MVSSSEDKIDFIMVITLLIVLKIRNTILSMQIIRDHIGDIHCIRRHNKIRVKEWQNRRLIIGYLSLASVYCKQHLRCDMT